MNTVSYTALRADLSKTMQQVCEDHDPIVITRSKAEPVVMISLSDFEELQETNYLMRSPANARRLLGAMDEIENLINKQ
jgi:antitoxin YefM